MSYSIRSGPSGAAPVRRPTAVNAAAAFMILMALVSLANAIASLTSMNGIVHRFRTAATRTDATGSDIDGMVALLRTSLILAAVVGAVVAVLLTVLASGNLRGSNGARVATWIVSGLGLACGCCGLAIVVAQRAMTLNLSGDTQVTEDLLRALNDAYPSWWIGLNGGLSAAQPVGYLVIALLLATPAANAFFRRSASVRELRPAGPARPGIPPSTPPPL